MTKRSSNNQLVLFEPEIPQNTGTLVRMCACFGMSIGLIEPASFILSDRRFNRASMDYASHTSITRYVSFSQMKQLNRNSRVILLDTKAPTIYYDCQYLNTDIIMVGRESTGVPNDIYNACDIKVKIPMIAGARSLNVAISAAIVVSELQRQLGYSSIKASTW